MPDQSEVNPATEQAAKEKALADFSRYLISKAHGPILRQFQEFQNQVRQLWMPILKSSQSMQIATPMLREMAARMGLHKGEIRIHQDEPAQAVAEALGAQAFSHGQDIYFAKGEGHPDTLAGQKLFAHELTHVAQQQGSTPDLALKGAVTPEAMEKQAEQAESLLLQAGANHRARPVEITIEDNTPQPRTKTMREYQRYMHILVIMQTENLIERHIAQLLPNDPELLAYVQNHDIEIDALTGTIEIDVTNLTDGEAANKLAYQSAQIAVKQARQVYLRDRILVNRIIRLPKRAAAIFLKARRGVGNQASQVISLARGNMREYVARIKSWNISAGQAVIGAGKTGLKWTGRQVKHSGEYLAEKAKTNSRQLAYRGLQALELTNKGAVAAGKQVAGAGLQAFEWTKEGLTATGKWMRNNYIAGKDWAVEFSGFGPAKLYDADVEFERDRALNLGVAKVDMKLDFFNPYEHKKYYKLMADLATGGLFANIRWNNAVRLAAPKIAQFINTGAYKLIEVPGVNDQGLDKAGWRLDKLKDIAKKLNLPENRTLVICHSAGTEAGLRSMRLIETEKRNQVYYLMLSPRVNPKRFARYLREAKIPRNHVMTINSLFDWAHWPDPDVEYPKDGKWRKEAFTIWLAETIYHNYAKPWHDYEHAPETGAHAFLTKPTDSENQKRINVGHGGMYEGFYENYIFNVKIGSNPDSQEYSMIELTNEFLNGKFNVEK